MTPATFNMRQCVSGDTVPGKVITVSFRDDAGDITTPDLSAYTAELSFEGKRKGATLELKSEAGAITLAGNVVTILEFTAPTEQDIYHYNLKLYRPDGAKLTYLEGELPVEMEV